MVDNTVYAMPFTVSEKELLTSAYKWLVAGNLMPDDILDNIKLSTIGVLIPLYYSRLGYNGTCSIKITTSQMTKRPINGVYQWVRVYQNYRQDGYHVNGEVAIFLYAGDDHHLALGKHAIGTKLYIGSLQHYNITPNSKIVIINAEGTYEELWKKAGYNLAYKLAENNISGQIPVVISNGSYISGTLKTSFLHTEHYFFYTPYYIATYKYRDEEYSIWMDGTNSERITGKKPKDKKRRNTIISMWAGMIMLISALLFLINNLDYNGDKSGFQIGIVIGGVIITWAYVKWGVIKKSVGRRNVNLTNALRKLQ